MGQAFDEHGNALGPEIIGPNRNEVLQKLEELHPDAAEVRIRKLRASVEEIEGEYDRAARNMVRKIDGVFGHGWVKKLADALPSRDDEPQRG